MLAITALKVSHFLTAALTAVRWNTTIDRLCGQQRKPKKTSCSGFEQKMMVDRLPHCVSQRDNYYRLRSVSANRHL